VARTAEAAVELAKFACTTADTLSAAWEVAAGAVQDAVAKVPWGTVAGIVVGVAVGLACAAATGGLAAVGCAVVAGAVGGALGYAQATAGTGNFSLKGMGVSAGIGMGTGALSGGVGAVIGSAVGSSVGSAIGSTAAGVLSGAAGGVAAGGVGYVAGSVLTGQDMTWQGAGEAMILGGAMGGLGGGLTARYGTTTTPKPTAALTAKPVASPSGAAGDYLYRGVASDHPGYSDALEGRAIPWGGHSDPALHNDGNTRSEFTSWTTDRSVAVDFATNGGSDPNGVVLRIPNADGPGLIRVPSPNSYHESEVLIQGPVSGADVTSP